MTQPTQPTQPTQITQSTQMARPAQMTRPTGPIRPTDAPAYSPLPIQPSALAQLRVTDDAGRAFAPFTDEEGDAPLRCCLRRSAPGERIALVSYAPLRRWAAATGVEPGAYDEQGPVFVHAECGGPGEWEGYPFAREGALRVVRRYDAGGRIVGGSLLELPSDSTEAFETAFAEAFADPRVVLVHVRAVDYGCFHFEVRRR